MVMVNKKNIFLCVLCFVGKKNILKTVIHYIGELCKTVFFSNADLYKKKNTEMKNV